MIRVPSPAKLNLFLHITGRRDNGYHELQTIFQLIDLYDWLEFEVNDTQSIQIQGLNSVNLEQNLIYKATQILKPYAKQVTGLNIKIDIEVYESKLHLTKLNIKPKNENDIYIDVLDMIKDINNNPLCFLLEKSRIMFY